MAFLNHTNNLCFVTLPSPSSSAELDKLQSKLDALEKVKKLCEFLTNLNNQQNEPKKLLDNLCTGLQTFLGFNSESKGYNGSGIVYSDLDRLCDAVMGFLSGVLGAVKDDEAVKTYDNYMTKKLKDVLDTLTSSIGTGRNGLAASVRAVKEWLEGYDTQITNKTNAVTNALTTLSNNLNDGYANIVESKKVDSLEKQLESWNSTVSDVAREIEVIEEEKISELDNALKNAVMNKIEPIKKSVAMLANSAKQDEFVQQASKVESELVKQRDIITDTVEDMVQNIRESVQSLETCKDQQIWLVKKTIERADAFLDRSLYTEYIYKILASFNQIECEVKNVYKSLNANKGVLENLVNKAREHFRSIRSGIQHGAGSEGNIEHQWDGFKVHLAKFVNGLYKQELEIDQDDIDVTNGLINEIESGVMNYGGNFAKRFDVAIGNVVRSIVSEKEGAVEKYIEQYVRRNNKYFKADVKAKLEGTGNTQIAAFVASHLSPIIEKQLQLHISQKIKQFEIVTDDSVDTVVGNIQTYLTTYAEAVDPIKVNTIVEMIEEHLEIVASAMKTQGYDNQYMTKIMKTVLTAVHAITLRVKEELNSFNTDSDNINYKFGKNIDESIKSFTQFDKLFKLTQQQVSEKFEDVKGKIGQLDTFLNKSEGKITRKLAHIEGDIIRLEKLQNDKNDIRNRESDVVIDRKGEEADRLMKELKIDLKHKLNEITVAVSNAGYALDTAIQSLLTTLNKSKDLCLQSVTSAFTTLTSEVRALFAEGHKADLAALKTLVDGQKAEIEKIIGEDKANNIKGLLQKIYGGLLYDRAGQNTNNTLEDMMETSKESAAQSREQSKFLSHLSTQFKSYSDAVLDYIRSQVKSSDSASDQSNQVGGLKNALDALLVHLNDTDTPYTINPLNKRIHLFDHKYDELLAILRTSLDTFTSPSPLLAPLKAGLSNFAQQLGLAYVNRYSGQTFKQLTKPVEPSKTAAAPEKPSIPDYDLTPEGRNCAKVCLTMVEILVNDFYELMKECQKSWKNKQINTYENNLFGKWLEEQGYEVNYKKGKQTGVLHDTIGMKGLKIYDELLNMNIGSSKRINLQAPWVMEIRKQKEADNKNPHQINVVDILQFLYGLTKTYYDVCHLRHIERPKSPSSVYQMLVWLTGLPHNRMNSTVSVGDISELFPKSDDEANGVGDGTIPVVDDDESLPAYPAPVTAANLREALRNVCTYAETVLISILGHGHANGVYAVDFNTNPDGFSYPTAPGACFDMLVDISKRLYDQLYFLFIQCSRTYETNSWRDCWYGRHVGGSDWRCNEKQCINQMGNQSADQKANQCCGQTCEQHPKCGLKSPLQSFLEDGLPGFLPHQFKNPGCKLDCSTANHRGLPCKTPMGFSDISNIASHTKQGEYIMNTLYRFCGQPDSPLNQLSTYLACLLSAPPATLGDMFAFFYNYLDGWHNQQLKERVSHREDAFDGAITKAYFGVKYDDFDLSLLFNAKHSDHNKHRDLISLVCGGDNKSVTNCGRYLQPINANTWTVFSKENADKYLSWIIYLTESFYKLLEQLYKECCANCTSAGSRCHGKTCVADCKVKSHYASLASAAKSKTPAPAPTEHQHNELCKPISHCPFTRPTLCKYGFVFKSLSNMSGENGELTMRTCKDLCNALQKVLSNKISDGAPLAKLVHEVIPKFIWAIRQKFFWTTVALWLLSLLYLLHIMVIRLDLLHIKSHLHSPSSHRIAAQSLLAAARVNKLNRVFYLQP
ncbi:hypothetical protein, conserved [Babesia bigemina]|uniref:C3H1-type domain-containing protein n=1 Tax=Babesia bigemina TaxID=5866 RepID=A0A061BKD5_BABBI|nr:hypothetical protein, conserved [Babesia bigemina]CDR71902.1 hypothetical protein, conserved [Babesia bigemina]|eukprot:XP_012770844.1 hypothetical protein, conserved [Babesia bigemina]